MAPSQGAEAGSIPVSRSRGDSRDINGINKLIYRTNPIVQCPLKVIFEIIDEH